MGKTIKRTLSQPPTCSSTCCEYHVVVIYRYGVAQLAPCFGYGWGLLRQVGEWACACECAYHPAAVLRDGFGCWFGCAVVAVVAVGLHNELKHEGFGLPFCIWQYPV